MTVRTGFEVILRISATRSRPQLGSKGASTTTTSSRLTMMPLFVRTSGAAIAAYTPSATCTTLYDCASATGARVPITMRARIAGRALRQQQKGTLTTHLLGSSIAQQSKTLRLPSTVRRGANGMPVEIVSALTLQGRLV